MKKGFLIAGIILFSIALILCALANFFVINALVERHNAVDAQGQLSSAFAILISIIFCIPLYIGQAVFNIAGILTAAQTLKSESHNIRVAGTVFLILNAVMILVSVGMFIAFFAICNSTASETAFVLNSLKV